MKRRALAQAEATPRPEQILEEARKICLTEGLTALTMRRVADAVGISATAIYRHFPDKAALVQAVIDEANHRLAAYLQRGLAAPDPWARFLRTLAALQEFGLRETHSYEILFFSRGRTDTDRLPAEQRSPNFVFWIDRLRECIDAGIMRRDLDPVHTGITIWALAHGLVALHLQGRFGGDERTFRQVWRRSMDHLLDGLRP